MQSYVTRVRPSASLFQPVFAISNFVIGLVEALNEAQKMRDEAARRYPHISFDT